jgi:predicted RND superfamily exporter protein
MPVDDYGRPSMKRLYDKSITWMLRHLILPHARWIVAVSIGLTAVAAWIIVSTWNINSDLRVLIPQDSEAARAMNEVDRRVGSTNSLFIVIDSPDLDTNKQFAADFADELRTLDSVAFAHYRNEKDFFETNALLYQSVDELASLHNKLEERIRSAKKAANPLFVSLDDDDADAGDEDTSLERSIDSARSDMEDAKFNEYFIGADGYSVTMVLRFNTTSTDLAATQRLIERVRQTANGLDPPSYNPDMEVEFGGALVRREATYNSILQDVQLSGLFTLLGLGLLLTVYFRRLRAIALVLTPLVMSVIWTLAVGFAWFGELNTISAFIFAILLGLGIDFSIHLLSGYDYRRAEGESPDEALVSTYLQTGRATLIGALTTFVTFSVVAFADFRGLSQFGQISSMGILLSIAAMYLVLPSLILTFYRLLPFEPSPLTESDQAIGSPGFMRIYAPAAAVVVVILTVGAATQIPHLGFQENFHKVGDFSWPWASAESQTTTKRTPASTASDSADDLADHVASTATELRQRVAPDSFEPERKPMSTSKKYTSALQMQYSSAPTILLFDEAAHARHVYNLLKQAQRRGELDQVRAVNSIYGFSPGTTDEQQRRLAEIRKIRQLLEREDLSVLEQEAQTKARKLLERAQVDDPAFIHELPRWTKRMFQEAGPQAHPARDGEPYAYEYVIFLTERADTMVGSEAREFLSQIERVRHRARQQYDIDFSVASQAYIYTVMLDQIKGEGAVMISIAIVLVAILLMLTFGDWRRGLVAFGPLTFGTIWTLGILGWVGLDLDFFNVVIIPVIIGLGVDDGVHFYRDYLEAGRGHLRRTLRRIGGAILMTSITSGVGFGGLAITDQNSLQSIGWLALFGIGSAFLATVTVMPTLIYLAERYDIEWMVSDDETRS